MLSELQQTFLQLVRLGIGHSVGLDSVRCENDNWTAITALAEKQGLSGVLSDGIIQLHPNERPPKRILLKLIGLVFQNYEYRYKQYQNAISELAKFYNDHGFKMMVLKGYACSLDWPKPVHRPCGDIDIWLFGAQKEADEVLNHIENLDVDSQRVSNKKVIDNSHHHHTVFEWQDFMVENHYDFINVHARKSNAKLEKIFKELGDECYTDSVPQKTQRGMVIPSVEVLGEQVYLPSANLHALFLIRHSAAHFAAAEITLRQVLDWAFFVEKHGNEVDWEWLVKVLEEFGLKQFFDVLNAICVEDLGFDFGLADITDNKESEFLRLKNRVLKDILDPEFHEEIPSGLLPRMWFRFRRWQANEWKQRLCYKENRLSALSSGIWNHILKPRSI